MPSLFSAVWTDLYAASAQASQADGHKAGPIAVPQCCPSGPRCARNPTAHDKAALYDYTTSRSGHISHHIQHADSSNCCLLHQQVCHTQERSCRQHLSGAGQ
jgi:hypothetical protein